MGVKKRAVFFDRDGTLLHLVYDKELNIVYTPRKVNQVKLMPLAKKVLKTIKELGFLTFIISNQPDIGLGRMTVSTFNKIQQKIHGLLDGEYYCLHHPFAKIAKYKKMCSCRKPLPGMLLQASKEHGVDLTKSWMVGDSVYDVIAGHKAGCKTILIANIPESGYLSLFLKQLGEVKPDYIVKKLVNIVPILQIYL